MQVDGESCLIAVYSVTPFRCVRGILPFEESTKLVRAGITH